MTWKRFSQIQFRVGFVERGGVCSTAFHGPVRRRTRGNIFLSFGKFFHECVEIVEIVKKKLKVFCVLVEIRSEIAVKTAMVF